MGLHVAAIDVDDAKLTLARKLGASLTINARQENQAEVIQRDIGGAHGVLEQMRAGQIESWVVMQF